MDRLEKLVKKINDNNGIGLNIISIQIGGMNHYYWEVESVSDGGDAVQGDLRESEADALFDFLINVDWDNVDWNNNVIRD